MRLLRYFPYEPRPHQLEVLRKVQDGVRRWNICLHAPTGFGKTPVILSALLPYAEEGIKILWAVRTGNETDRPVEELKAIVERKGVSAFGLSYRGKRDMCLLAKEFGEELDHSDVSYLCSAERNRCVYYRRFKKLFDPAPFLERGPLLYSEVFEICRGLLICPYYAQRALVEYADLVALSYNYVIDPRLEWSMKTLVSFKDCILVVDEAHNLQNVNLASDTITLGTLRRAFKEAQDKRAREVAKLVKHAEAKALEIFKRLGDEEDTTFNPEDLIPEGSIEVLEEAREVGEQIRKERLRRRQRPRSSLYHLATFLLSALELSGTRGIAFIAEREGSNLKLTVWDMRAADVLAGRWAQFRRVVFCSGTLEPIDAFAEVVGLSNYLGIRVPNIYRRDKVRVYIVKGLTTRGEELSEGMARAYVRAIALMLKKVKCNTAVFTASYRVQEGLVEAGLLDKLEELGYVAFIERRGMSGQEARKMLEEFKSTASDGRGVLIAPMGGRFAEGADFPGEELKAVFLAGIPFEKPTVKTRLYVSYYEEVYGRERGRMYAYVLPALRRAAQALGRAVRSPDDEAVLVLGDERYLRYAGLLPDYVREWATVVAAEELDLIRVPWS